MKELRCLVFSDREVVAAVFERRRKIGEAAPHGHVVGITFHMSPHAANTLEAVIHVTDDLGDDRALTVDQTEITAALVTHCMKRNIPLPVESDKTLHLINGSATLMITMNFKRPPRLVPLHTHDRDDGNGAYHEAERVIAATPGPAPSGRPTRRPPPRRG